MKRFLLPALMLALIPFIAAQPQTKIAESCGSYEPLISISDPDNTTSHPAEPGFYSQNACVKGIEESVINSSCEKNTGFYLSGRKEEAHLSTYESYDLNVCTGVVKTRFNQSCTGNETVLFSVSGEENAHVAGPELFDLKACASFERPENVSLITEFNLSSSDNVYFDSQEIKGEETFRPPADFPYIASRSGNSLSGIVTSSFQESSRKIEGENRLKVVRELSNPDFLVPFTEADINGIEDRKQEIKDRTFMETVRPSFGFEIPVEPRVKIRFAPGTALWSDLDIPPGSYSLKIRKTGENKVNITVD